MPDPERIDRHRAALIAYDVCRRALTPLDPARNAAMRPVLDAWVRTIAAARAADLTVDPDAPIEGELTLQPGGAATPWLAAVRPSVAA